jgi:hypothetical protein
MAKRRRRGNRFRLLVYGRMWQRWALPCVLIIPASLVLWWGAPRISILNPSLRPLALVPALISAVILAYTFLARSMAWVQCRPGHIRIQTPIYPLAVSYNRITGVRPKPFAEIFNTAAKSAARQDWLQPFGQQTAIVVSLSKYPVSRAWLRLWFSPYLLDPKDNGFVFLVEDWMALSRQVDEYRIAWETRHKPRPGQGPIRRLH